MHSFVWSWNGLGKIIVNILIVKNTWTKFILTLDDWKFHSRVIFSDMQSIKIFKTTIRLRSQKDYDRGMIKLQTWIPDITVLS